MVDPAIWTGRGASCQLALHRLVTSCRRIIQGTKLEPADAVEYNHNQSIAIAIRQGGALEQGTDSRVQNLRSGPSVFLVLPGSDRGTRHEGTARDGGGRAGTGRETAREGRDCEGARRGG